jgi:hypothetical protein
MTRCGLCGEWLDFTGHVGEIDLRDWYIGKAEAFKTMTCSECLDSIKEHVEGLKVA